MSLNFLKILKSWQRLQWKTAHWQCQKKRSDGVILSCDGWGNSHVDYTNTMEQIGTRGIPVTGITFNGTVAQFVVVNDYLDGVVDMNKSASGEETNVVGENNMTERDCKLALAKLKLKMRQKEQKE